MAQTLQKSVQDRQPYREHTFWWKTAFARQRLVWTGALAAIFGVTAWFGLRAALTPDVNQLLAKAYTEKRMMDLRIPGAKHAPLRMERSTTGSTTEQPQALLDANALISRELHSRPDDPVWLQAKAEADLLEFHYDPAIQTLRRALDLRPDSPPLMIDLASAYYQRAATNSDREVDYGMAVDYLGRALAKTPDDPVALFNRAVSEARLHLYDPAIEDWQHYLRIDSKGPWAEEARQRLQEVQKKVSNKESSLSRPLLTTKELASLVGSSDQAEEIDSRVEDYLHTAVREWLPRAFPQSSQPRESREAQIALTALAEVTQRRHGDLWLADLLGGSHGPGFESGVFALSVAVEANDSGDYAGGRASAQKASNLFHSAGNLAGYLRAQAEEVYADHLLYDGGSCMTALRRLGPRLRQHKYEWLQAQMSLEESNCASLLGDLGRTRIAINRGTRRAGNHQYSGLFLRGVGFQADSAALLGDTQEGFSLASKGLDLFWSSQVDLMKGYNLYTDLDTAGDVLRLPNLQVVLWQQATALVDLHPDLVQRAMAHRWFGNSAYLAHMPDLAAREFSKASALFTAAPRTEATARGKMDADIWLAGLESRQGDMDHAVALLQKVQGDLVRAPSFDPEIDFYTTQAEVSLRREDSGTTESALRSAIFLAEWALRSLPSENARRQWAKQTEHAYRNLVAWKLRQGDAGGALELWEWHRGAEFRSGESFSSLPRIGQDLPVPPDARNAPPILTPSAVADHLPRLQEETIITYATFSDGTAVWVYDDRGIFSQWIATSRANLESRAIQFQHLCSTRDSNMASLRSTARTLYDLLIAPIEGHLVPGRALVFEPDDVVSTIPMEALIDRDGHYLVERAIVVVSPGLYQTLRLRPAVVISSETPALVVSVPVPSNEDLAPLPDAESEAQVVAESFRSVRWLRSRAANLAAIRQDLRGTSVFHFAGHAVALPEMNGLLLAEQDARTLRARLIDAESLGPEAVQDLQLAVLSACDTGAASGSGTEGLAQGLLRAGVPHVVASRWHVDSTETAIFMRRFYERLLAGNNVPNSLRAAQLALASQPGSAHPYYWAAFGVQGL